MRSIVLAGALFAGLTILLMLIPRVRPRRTGRSIFFPFCVALALLPLYALLYAAVPADFLPVPNSWMESRTVVDFCNGICLYLLLAVGLNDLLIAAVSQPFSTDVLMVYRRAGRSGAGADDVVRGCTRGTDSGRHLERRLHHLLSHGYLRAKEDGGLVATPKGLRLAGLIGLLCRFTVTSAVEDESRSKRTCFSA